MLFKRESEMSGPLLMKTCMPVPPWDLQVLLSGYFGISRLILYKCGTSGSF